MSRFYAGVRTAQGQARPAGPPSLSFAARFARGRPLSLSFGAEGRFEPARARFIGEALAETNGESVPLVTFLAISLRRHWKWDAWPALAPPWWRGKRALLALAVRLPEAEAGF